VIALYQTTYCISNRCIINVHDAAAGGGDDDDDGYDCVLIVLEVLMAVVQSI